VLAAVAAALLAAGSAPRAAAAEADPTALLDRLEATWKAHDLPGYLGLLHLPDDERRAAEREYVVEQWAGQESRLEIERPAQVPSAAFKTPGTIVSITEPHGRVEQAVFTIAPGPEGWWVTDRQTVSQLEGLVHLSLGPAFRADGLILKLPDFELRLQHGTLFTPPADVGPTALVFVGEATVRFSPGPAMEKEQLRQFCGRTELVDTVHAAFFRIHPADLRNLLSPVRLEPDARATAARPAAMRFFREHVDDTYQIEGRLPRAPWWLIPALGDAVATFQTRRGALTLTVSHSEPEGVSLFDRARRRQICLYALPGAEARYDEDDTRDVDVVHHDLSVRFEPDRFALSGVDVVRLRLRSPSSTIRLRLDESLHVISIRSREGGDHLFFRVRHQDGMMVSLGALSGTLGEIELTVRYAGVHAPQPVEHEVLPQVVAPPVGVESDIVIDETLVYSNRTAWYPQGEADDYATAVLHYDVPAGMMAVSGGQQSSLKTEGGRTRVEYRQDLPGKYITVAVGRLQDAGRQTSDGVTIAAWASARLKSRSDLRIGEAAEILRFYVTEFGPCPYPSINLVLLESRVPGGHSPPGMVVVSVRPVLFRSLLRDDPASFPDAPDFFIAHELAHQWWGHGVAGANYHERWMSEAFAQYAAALWVRHSRGEAPFRDMLERMGRWALRYSSKGPIYLGYRLGHIEGDPQVYRAVVYDKGAYVLHMLRQIVGEDAFRRAGITFQAVHRFTKVGTDDFRRALEAASGMSLEPYFAEWVYDTRVPEVRVATRSHPTVGGYRTEITVKGLDVPGPLPLELEVAHAAGTEVRTVELPPEGGSWTVDTPGPPRRTDVNATRGLLLRVRRD
jgi:peptidase M1-like protein